MPEPSGFAYVTRKGGEVVVRHNGRQPAVLRGARAVAFLADAASGDAQAVMARVTGNYRRGNERRAAAHPRNAPSGDA